MKTLRSRAEADVAAIVTSAGNARGKAVAAELAAMRKAFDAAAQVNRDPPGIAAPGGRRSRDVCRRPDEAVRGACRAGRRSPKPSRNSSRSARRRTRNCGSCSSRPGWTSKPHAPTSPPSVKAPIPCGPARQELTGEFDRALDEMRRDHATVLAEQSAASIALPLDELLTVFNAMKKAETGPELLGALLTGLAREFSRVALFHIDGTRLVAAERLGFADTDTSKPIRLPADSILTRAVATGRLESVIPSLRGEPNTSLPFGGTPACALAIPIVLSAARRPRSSTQTTPTMSSSPRRRRRCGSSSPSCCSSTRCSCCSGSRSSGRARTTSAGSPPPSWPSSNTPTRWKPRQGGTGWNASTV